MRQTFKEYLKEVRYYKQREQEDWQHEINDHGQSYGVCPRCGGEAHTETEGAFPATARWYWECQECGYKGRDNRY